MPNLLLTAEQSKNMAQLINLVRGRPNWEISQKYDQFTAIKVDEKGRSGKNGYSAFSD